MFDNSDNKNSFKQSSNSQMEFFDDSQKTEIQKLVKSIY